MLDANRGVDDAQAQNYVDLLRRCRGVRAFRCIIYNCADRFMKALDAAQGNRKFQLTVAVPAGEFPTELKIHRP